MWWISLALAAEPYPIVSWDRVVPTRNLQIVAGEPLREIELRLRDVWTAAPGQDGQEVYVCQRVDGSWRLTVSGWKGERRFVEVRHLADLSLVARKDGGMGGQERQRCIRYWLRGTEDRLVVLDTESLIERPLVEAVPGLVGALRGMGRFVLPDGRVVALDRQTLELVPSAPLDLFPIDPPGPFASCSEVGTVGTRSMFHCNDPGARGWLVCVGGCVQVDPPREPRPDPTFSGVWMAHDPVTTGWFEPDLLTWFVPPEPLRYDSRRVGPSERWTLRADGSATIVGRVVPETAEWVEVHRIDDCPGVVVFSAFSYADEVPDVAAVGCVTPSGLRDARQVFTDVIDVRAGVVWRTPHHVAAVQSDRTVVLLDRKLHDSNGWFGRVWTAQLPR